MLTAISHHGIWVFDQDEALDFYAGKLGLEVASDVDLEIMRWLTVTAPGRREHQIVLMLAAPPAVEAQHVDQLREVVARGNGGTTIITTDDCRAEHARLAGLGVEFTEEPTERFYGIDCGFRDPFGNALRLTQPATQPIVPPKRWEPAGA